MSRYEDPCPACGRQLPGIHLTCPRCESLAIDFREGPPIAGRPPGWESPIEVACRDCGLVWKPGVDEVLDAAFDEGEERERAEFHDLLKQYVEQVKEAATRELATTEPPSRHASRSGCGGCLGSVLILVGIVTAFGEPLMGIALLVLGVVVTRLDR